MEVVREKHLAEKVVIVNGQPGCGKTMLSPIVAALDRVELLTYALEIECICALHRLQRIESDAAAVMVRMLTDYKLYTTMMSRETNFRPRDLSSAFRDAHTMRYVRRLFQKGDEFVPERIRRERPILNLTTHNLLPCGEPIFAGLGKRVVFVEVVRHPLYMLKQQALNMERLFHGDVRDFTMYFKYGEHQLPFFVQGWEEIFLGSNAVEKAIYAMERLTRAADEKRVCLSERYDANILVVPFERFVVDPWPYMKQLEHALGSRVTSTTRKMMRKQRVPRKKYAEGIDLQIYRRCGWEPPESGASEKDELAVRRQFAADQASSEAMRVLDGICAEYEQRYMQGLSG